MESPKLVVVKLYKATQEDWRNPNIYIDTDPSDDSGDSEGDSFSIGSTGSDSLRQFPSKNSARHVNEESLLKMATLDVKSEPPIEPESSSNSSYRLPKSFSFNNNVDPQNENDPQDTGDEQRLLARFDRFPYRKYIRANRKLSLKSSNETQASDSCEADSTIAQD